MASLVNKRLMVANVITTMPSAFEKIQLSNGI